MQSVRYNHTVISKSEPCPCGSGELYRACCLRRKDMEIPRERMEENPGFLNHFILSRLTTNNLAVCLHPNQSECQGAIKKAHALQNNRILSKIDVGNHVLVAKQKVDINGVTMLMERESRNKATTFTGFCDKHDTEVFLDIERGDYTGTQKQNFLFAYRAFAQQFHKTQVAMATHRQLAHERPSLLRESEEFVMLYRNRQLEVKDMDEYKAIFDEALLHDKYETIETLNFELPTECKFAICAAFALERDVLGHQLNDVTSFEDERLKSVFITVFPAENKTHILFSWLKEEDGFFSKYKEQLIKLSHEQLQIYLNNLIPLYTENIVMSPLLWDKLTPFSQRKFMRLLTANFPRMDATMEDMIESMNELDKVRREPLTKPGFDLFKQI
ncbi:YecA family protein [Paenibacillus cremeus]|uniref:SEC-C domain-containing protein n=1 Tax=Paenibacillus cremeus TaxID=2163881 RepID=A0A559KAB4_9BACL|nr:SEC-C domain-containing protein [Paenibacillus cremeus]TVY09066.1 SEC-C domain-containing protein [Paenibacillus cremeus]